MSVSVLIVNYNGRHLLGECLGALRHQTVPPVQVIVVDNGSSDDSRAFLERYDWPLLECHFLERNTGFSGGNNAGLPQVRGEVVALLNTDAVADPTWIERALPHFATRDVGMVACKTRRLQDPGTIDKVGHLAYADGLNRGRGTGQPDDGRFDQVADVLWPDGSAGFYRMAMIAEIGPLEERFFLYGEDAELGMRAQWAGYRCIYEPTSTVRHFHSAGLGRFSPKKAYFIERNRIWVLAKTYPWSMVLASPFHTLLRYLWNLYGLIADRGSAAGFQRDNGPWPLVLALLRANWDGLLGLPTFLRLRRSYPRRITPDEMCRLLKRHRISAREIALQD